MWRRIGGGFDAGVGGVMWCDKGSGGVGRVLDESSANTNKGKELR